jgi:hypothetical protein
MERMAAVGTNPSRLSIRLGGRDTVRMILNGRSKQPRVNTLAGLSRELKCDVRYLLGQTDEVTPGELPPPSTMSASVSPSGRVTLDIKADVSMGVAAKILALIEGDKP